MEFLVWIFVLDQKQMIFFLLYTYISIYIFGRQVTGIQNSTKSPINLHKMGDTVRFETKTRKHKINEHIYGIATNWQQTKI